MGSLTDALERCPLRKKKNNNEKPRLLKRLLFLLFTINMHRWAHISFKNNDIFSYFFLSGNENSKWESNPMLWLLFLYLSRSAFLVSFTDPNKQLPKVKSMFKFLSCKFSVQEIYRFSTFLGIEILFTKQCLLKFMSSKKWWLKIVGAKLLSALVIFSIFLFQYFLL